jgi:carboxymethylenebutenolidase
MCDNDFDRRHARSSSAARALARQFGAMTVGTGLMFMLPKLANAAEVKESEVEIKTADGTCDAYFVHPATASIRAC